MLPVNESHLVYSPVEYIHARFFRVNIFKGGHQMTEYREILRLTALAEAFQNQLMDSSVSALAFEERLGLLVDIEWASRKNNRLRRLIKSANLDQNPVLRTLTTDQEEN